MRFAAAQIPAKIGARSLNGEKLDELHFIALIFGQFAVLHAHFPDFFTPPFARRRRTDTAPHLSRISEKCTLNNPRQANKVSAVWGGETPHCKPRHADRTIEPVGVYAAEEQRTVLKIPDYKNPWGHYDEVRPKRASYLFIL